MNDEFAKLKDSPLLIATVIIAGFVGGGILIEYGQIWKGQAIVFLSGIILGKKLDLEMTNGEKR